MNKLDKPNRELIAEISSLKKKIRKLDKKEADLLRELEELRKSEEKYRFLLTQSPDPTFSFTPEGQYTFVNKAFALGVGKPVEDIIGKTIWNVFPKEEADKRFLPLSHVFRTGVEKVIEVRVPRPDGDRYYVTTITPITDTKGNTHSAICSSKDITERKRMETQLQDREEQMRVLFEHSGTAVIIIEDDTTISLANQEFATRVGYTREEIENRKKWAEFVDEKDLQRMMAQHRLRRASPKKAINSYEFRFKSKSGELRDTLLNINLIPGTRKSIASLIDITDRKQAEEESNRLQKRLLQAEKMEALGTMAGGVAHDLNNVLGILVGYSELLLANIAEDSPLHKHVEKMMLAGVRAAAIVQDLLTLARRGVHAESVVNLNAIITDFQKTPEFENLQTSNPLIRMELNLAPDLLNIKGSTSHVSKTFMNLLTNAVEAMPGGGKLTVTTGNQNLDTPVHGYDDVREGDYATLTVSDTGEGIAKKDLKHIFEPFYTKKVMGRSGTGLGLAVAWGTVKDHKGYIDVQSETGKGTNMILYFPVTREELPESSAAIPTSDYIGKDESILVVDDIKEQRELASMILGNLNYRVATAASGEDAVEYLKSHRADLIVLDMIMDPGMDGLDTYKSILEIHPKQKAIIVSGFSESDRVQAAQSLGAGAYLRKPYIMEKLGITVRKELDRPASSRK